MSFCNSCNFCALHKHHLYQIVKKTSDEEQNVLSHNDYFKSEQTTEDLTFSSVPSHLFWILGCKYLLQVFSYIESQICCRGKIMDLYLAFGEKVGGRQEEETDTDQAMRLRTGER